MLDINITVDVPATAPLTPTPGVVLTIMKYVLENTSLETSLGRYIKDYGGWT